MILMIIIIIIIKKNKADNTKVKEMQGNKLKNNKTKQKKSAYCNIQKQEMCVMYNKHRYITFPILVTYLQWPSADQPVAHPIPSIFYKSPSNCILLSGI